MKKVKFLVNVPDKYTREEYKKGQVKEFENERADEILSAKRIDGGRYAEEVKETAEEIEEQEIIDEKEIEEVKEIEEIKNEDEANKEEIKEIVTEEIEEAVKKDKTETAVKESKKTKNIEKDSDKGTVEEK